MDLTSKLQNTIGKQFKFVRNINIIFDIDFPILFTFEARDVVYLAYTVDYSPLKLVAKVIVVPSSLKSVLELVTERKSIQSVLIENDNFTILNMNIKKKNLEIQEVLKSEVEEYFPSNNFMLTKVVPNRINLTALSRYLEEETMRAYLSNWDTTNEISKGFNSKDLKDILFDNQRSLSELLSFQKVDSGIYNFTTLNEEFEYENNKSFVDENFELIEVKR